MIELELKFEVPPASVAALDTALKTGGSQRSRLQAYYFDTADNALAQHGLALRLRKAGRRWEQTLKAGGDDWVERLEHNVAVAAPAAGGVPVVDASRHTDTPPGRMLDKALAHAQQTPAALVECYRTDIWRRTWEVREGDAVIELALDQGRISAGARELAVCELEVELKTGEPAAMVAVARRLAAQYGLCLSTTSKAARGHRLAQGEPFGPAQKAQPLQLQASMSKDTVLRTVVRNCLGQLLVNASALLAGSDAEEHIHQLRVGLRRLRTALRELGDFADSVDPAWEPALSATFARLGEFRDQNTVMRNVQPRLAAAGAPLAELPSAVEHGTHPGEAVRDAQFQMVLIQLIGFCLQQSTPAGTSKADKPKRELRARLKRLHRNVVQAGEHFPELAPDAQHRVRKRLKRLRYLSEFGSSLFNAAAVECYLVQLRASQDALGVHNDDVVALEAYRAAAAEDARAWFGAGWLTAQLAVTAADCQKALQQLARAPVFWKKAMH